MRAAPRYDEPFFWWGPRWDRPTPRPLRDLLRDGTIDLWRAAHLWAALARRQSLVVVGASSGVGKTTLVTALCELLPAETRRLYIRGCFEDFAFLRDSAIEANRSALLVNELSPHLPVYLWGPGVAEVLRATERGFMVLASAHASSALEFVATLAGSPLQLNPRLIAAFRVVISVGSEEPLSPQARITGVWRMLPTRSGVAIDALAARGLPTGTTPDRAWFPPVEISERMQLLATFAAGREPLPTVVRILPDDDEQRIGGVAP